MAIIRDMIPAFELYQPASSEAAIALLDKQGKDAWVMAGGLDSLDWFKDRAKRPKALVDLSQVQGMAEIRDLDGGVEIGAMATLTQIATHPRIQADYGLLAQAARQVATPQIRHQGTLGGNVSQDTRCWYYRGGMPCYRAGGNTCYADTPTAMNREHCLFEADRCVAVTPSDTAPALIALEAQMVIQSAKGERVVEAEDFFIGPNVDITRMTVLQPGELLTAVRIPKTWAGARFYFEKAADRQAWDFALVNVACAMQVDGSAIKQVRLAVGGVACRPLRMKEVEDSVRGEPLSPETAALAGKTSVWGAKPLNYNHFKIPLMKNLVQRAIRGA
ncbi:MAG: molybdopterin dehydrogenase [Candidatus Entotheonella factor]|uniref:Molybdopterin dehydrogenase n=1 Tax=Entotheonella factor TaxID=1429438 RepID=W4LWV3_ENTF1|nr:MAG: molybdopterin dehydrogenase [Candidatus Entotheonella factor]